MHRARPFPLDELAEVLGSYPLLVEDMEDTRKQWDHRPNPTLEGHAVLDDGQVRFAAADALEVSYRTFALHELELEITGFTSEDRELARNRLPLESGVTTIES